jgi:hypothetical protein
MSAPVGSLKRSIGRWARCPARAEQDEKYATTVEIIRQIALTGCRRSEMIGLMWTEATRGDSSVLNRWRRRDARYKPGAYFEVTREQALGTAASSAEHSLRR